MIAIRNIASYIPETRVSNYDVMEKFSVDSEFIENKLGVKQHAQITSDNSVIQMCMDAFAKLQNNSYISVNDIGMCLLVTQNPDVLIPHNSAILHGELDLPEECIAYDISLGCSGYVYALATARSLMDTYGIGKGLIFTCDPYSRIMDSDDKNTSMIFGDAATATLVEKSDTGLQPLFFDFGTNGKKYSGLTIKDEKLYMNGRAVFNFTAQKIPVSIEKVLSKGGLAISDIEEFFLHQGSKYIIDTICERAGIEPSRAMFDMYDYGNTVSSSVPLLIEKRLGGFVEDGNYIASGFGVGLSWSTCLMKYVGEK